MDENGMVAEDVTEVSWEDLVTDMVEADGPDENVATAAGGSGGVATCVTTYTSTGSCVDG